MKENRPFKPGLSHSLCSNLYILKIKMESSTELPSYLADIPKIWKTSITKTELAELPAETFDRHITVVDTQEAIDAAADVLARARVIGFDTETKPSFKRGEHHRVALLQLSTPDECFLFRLNIIGMPARVAAILEDENLVKIGLSIHDDFINLRKICRLEPKGFVELQDYVKTFNISDNSLSRIYGILFDKRISKGQRLSNWEAPVLTSHQQEYAALDALACITIYDYLQTVGFDYRSSKYYREFEDQAAIQHARQMAEKSEKAAHAAAEGGDKANAKTPRKKSVRSKKTRTAAKSTVSKSVSKEKSPATPKPRRRRSMKTAEIPADASPAPQNSSENKDSQNG